MSKLVRVSTFCLLLAVAGCAPAPPAASPTAAPATTAPSKPAAPASPAAAGSPAAASQPSPVASPSPAPGASPSPAAAKPASPAFDEQAVAQFYTGKTITIVVGFSAGGGYDQYARLLQRSLGQYIPGNPTVIVQNMPGAGSLLAANHLFNAAAKDGTVIGTFARGVPTSELLGQAEARFKSSEFNWIGSMTDEISVCAIRSDAPAKSFDDLYTTAVKVGATGTDADDYRFPKLLNAIYGTKFEIVPGYPGTPEILLAIEKGEIQGYCSWAWTSLSSSRPQWLESPPFVNLVVQFGLTKHPRLQTVPQVLDLAKTDEQRQIVRMAVSSSLIGRPFVAPPGVPADRVAALRAAFDKAVVDPTLLAEAQAAKLDLSPVSGAELQRVIGEIFSAPPDLVRKLAAAVSG